MKLQRVVHWGRRAGRVVPTAALLFALAGWWLPEPLHAQAFRRLDQFSKTLLPNELIPDWESKKFSPYFGSGDRYFFQFVHKSDKVHYIHLRSGSDNSFSVGSEAPFKLQDYPVLEWEWKVTTLPKGGDVRVNERDDQAGAMCVIVDPGLTGFESFCYVWENKGPMDTPITSTKREDSRYLILKAGPAQLGTWFKERRNILADYKRLFGKEPTEEAIIGLQIDSDDTETSAEAFYRNIYLRKS